MNIDIPKVLPKSFLIRTGYLGVHLIADLFTLRNSIAAN